MTGPVRDERTGRMTGVAAKAADGRDERTYRARVVVAADGNSVAPVRWPWACASATTGRSAWRSGRYYRTHRHDDDYLESWLDLWDGDRLLPGYGWIFGMGDGTVQRRAWAC